MTTEMKYQVKLNNFITLTLSEEDTIIVSKSWGFETYTVSDGQCLLRCLLRQEPPDVNESYYRLINGQWELTTKIRHKTAFQFLDSRLNPGITMITIVEE